MPPVAARVRRSEGPVSRLAVVTEEACSFCRFLRIVANEVSGRPSPTEPLVADGGLQLPDGAAHPLAYGGLGPIAGERELFIAEPAE